MELSKKSMPDLYKIKKEVDDEIYRRGKVIKDKERQEYEQELSLIDHNDSGYKYWLRGQGSYNKIEYQDLDSYRRYKLSQYDEDQTLVDMGR